MSISERRIHQVFQVSVLLKGAHALIECAGGIAFALINKNATADIVNAITQEELVEDPNDFIATHPLMMAHSFSVQTKRFYAFYLLSHGVVKVLLVVGLLRNKLWSYPASLIVLGLFVAYQLYRYSYTHGLGLIVLTVFDVTVMVLIGTNMDWSGVISRSSRADDRLRPFAANILRDFAPLD